MMLEINGDRYWREADMSAWGKEHRMRKDP